MNNSLENQIMLIVEIVILNIASTWWYVNGNFQAAIAVFSAIGAIIYTLFFKGEEEKQNQKVTPQKRKVVLTLISSSILMLIIGLAFNCDKKPTVRITSPKMYARVNIETNVKGTTKNLPPEYKIWVVVYNINRKKFFPHSNTTILPNNENETWESTVVNVGTFMDINSEFDIYAIAYKQNDPFSTAMSSYLAKSDRDGILLKNIPEFELFDKVTVTLK